MKPRVPLNRRLHPVQGSQEPYPVFQRPECCHRTAELNSNKATDTQIQTLTRFAQQAANKRITLFPDCDEEGEARFKDLMWKLAEARLQIQLACASTMFDGAFANHQPEDLTLKKLQACLSRPHEKSPSREG